MRNFNLLSKKGLFFVLLFFFGGGVEVQEIVEFGRLDLFEITVDGHHNFFVSENELLVHNFVAAAAGVVAAVEVAEVVAGIATGVAVIAGLKSSGDSGELVAEKTKNVAKDSGKNVTDESEEAPREIGAQAPGKPKEEYGFVPKKKSEGGKVKVKKGRLKGKAGWPDKKDNVWVPTGENDLEKPHWDVQNPKTGTHTNVYPGGKIRGKDTKR